MPELSGCRHAAANLSVKADIMFHSTIVLEILFVLLWNSGFIGAEYGLPYAGVFTQLFWRYLLLTIILFLYLGAKRRMRWPGWSATAPVFFVGILAHAVWLSCCLLSIQYGVPAGIVALAVALQPLTTGALSGVVAGEPTPIIRWVGLLTGFIGVALTILARVSLSDTTPSFAYFIPLGAVAAMTAATLTQRKLEVQKPELIIPLDLSLFYQCLASTLVLAIPAALWEGMVIDPQPVFLGIMAWLILAVSLCAYGLLFNLIKRIDATREASLFYLGPPVTMLMAWVAFGDTLQFMDVIGLLITGTGVVISQLQL